MLGKQLQSLILELMATWPMRVIGNMIWTIFDYWVSLIEGIANSVGLNRQVWSQSAYQLSDLNADRTHPGERYVDLNVDTAQLFIGLDLPPASQQRTTTTEIAIPVLLPDRLDTPEASPSQFFDEHFEIYAKNEMPTGSMDICLIDPDGQVLFHSQPQACPILKPWHPLILLTGQG